MRHYPIPFNETARLDALAGIRAHRDAATPALDEIVELVRELFEVPTALVSLVDEDIQWFKARSGFDLAETPRDLAICAHTILTGAPLVIPDTHANPRFAEHPVVAGPPHIRFYCGAPIVLSSGLRVGSLCAIDYVAREAPSAARIDTLTRLARVVAATLELATDGPIREPGTLPGRESREHARDEFLSLIGHELLTPLNGILGLAQCLDDVVADDLGREVVDGIRSSSEHLQSLLERILKFSDVATGELQLKEEWIHRDTLVADTLSLVGPQIAAAGHELHRAPLAVPDRLYLDAAQMALVLSAVLGNAAVHGGPQIRVSAHTTADGALVFSVQDDGPGMDAEQSADILEPFAVGEAVRRRHGSGIGLGLPLAKRLLQLHGGELRITRDEGWTSVEIVLPSWRGMPD